MTAADLDAIRAGVCPLHGDALDPDGRCPRARPAIMPLDALDECPAAIVNGYGITRAEYAAASPPRLRAVVGTEPYGAWARRDELILAVDPTTGRTEVAQLVGMLIERGSATVHWPDRRWSHCPLANIVAPLEADPTDRRWTS